MDYFKWRKAYRIIQRGEHLSQNGISQNSGPEGVHAFGLIEVGWGSTNPSRVTLVSGPAVTPSLTIGLYAGKLGYSFGPLSVFLRLFGTIQTLLESATYGGGNDKSAGNQWILDPSRNLRDYTPDPQGQNEAWTSCSAASWVKI